MNTLTHVFLVGSTVALLLSGCAHYKQMTDGGAIRIADRAAMKHGFHLADFEPARVLSHEGHRWSVFYDGKIPPADRNGLVELKLGNHFVVWVDDRTGATQMMLGE